MTDARADIAGAVNFGNETLLAVQDTLRALFSEYTLTLSAIARRQCCSRSMLYKEPWRVPGFGAGNDAGKQPWECYLATYQKWMAVPEEERKKQWVAMRPAEKKAIRKARAA